MRSTSFRLVLLVAVLAAGIGAGSSLAVADHVFPDHPPGNAFHDAVAAFGGAGCATGFPDGSFRGQDEVRRQQMARFVQNCAGRVESDEGSVIHDGAPLFRNDVADVDVVTGAQAEGSRGLVLVQVHAFITTGPDGSGCTCQALLTLRPNDEPAPLQSRPVSLPPIGDYTVAASFSEVVIVEAGTVNNFRVDVSKLSGTADLEFAVEIVATYVPFTGDGSAAPEPA